MLRILRNLAVPSSEIHIRKTIKLSGIISPKALLTKGFLDVKCEVGIKVIYTPTWIFFDRYSSHFSTSAGLKKSLNVVPPETKQSRGWLKWWHSLIFPGHRSVS
jgi:hypothetical protein